MKNVSKMAGLAILALLSMNACKDGSDDDISLPPIGGFNSADEVGAADLLAHFPMDQGGKEHISGAAPSESKNATYVTGKKGSAVSFAAGYLAYDPIAKLSSNTTSYSASAWVQMANNKAADGTGGSATMVFSMTRPNEWAGNFNLMAETGWYKAAVDTLVPKALLVSQEGTPPSSSFQDSRPDPAKGGDQVVKGAGADKWTHLVITWDATSSNFLVYANGKKVSNPEWENRKVNGVGMGDLVFSSALTRPLIGAFNTNTPGNGPAESWQVPMTGKVDEVRVWKKALSAAEIDALYQLESAGR